MTKRPQEIARTISALYYSFDTSHPFTRDDMDLAIATALRAYAVERIEEFQHQVMRGDHRTLMARAQPLPSRMP